MYLRQNRWACGLHEGLLRGLWCVCRREYIHHLPHALMTRLYRRDVGKIVLLISLTPALLGEWKAAGLIGRTRSPWTNPRAPCPRYGSPITMRVICLLLVLKALREAKLPRVRTPQRLSVPQRTSCACILCQMSYALQGLGFRCRWWGRAHWPHESPPVGWYHSSF